ncbi:hypothetical protein ACWDU3_07995 [Streptomyces olivaceus]|uniref:hypothetical protein n=1 Tax=Streptomyces olivaceus TaxID=47716 RepID=UPI001CCB07F3|nr:hypothetical protein [Streptomyces olivaceus]MBZ6081848.1 hypothetical protein [Streptomyces olivaceus]
MEDPPDQTAHLYYSTPFSGREISAASLQYDTAVTDVERKQVAASYGMSVEEFEALIDESMGSSPEDD